MISRLKIHSTHNGADLFCINPHLATGTAAGAQQARPVNVGGRDRESEVVCLNPAEVLSESTERMKLRRLLEQYGLEDEDDVLDNNDVKKDRDLSFIDDDVLKDLTLSPVSKGHLVRSDTNTLEDTVTPLYPRLGQPVRVIRDSLRS